MQQSSKSSVNVQTGGGATVFCQSAQRWISGRIVSSVIEGYITVEYQIEDKPFKKSLELTSEDLYVEPTDDHVLTMLPSAMSSLNVRTDPTSMSCYLCTKLRQALSADCALINSGYFRGEKNYPCGEFTYGDLQTEMPNSSNVVVLPLPGKVIEATYQYAAQARDRAVRENPGRWPPGWAMQVDDEMSFQDYNILTIRGQPFDSGFIYKTVVVYKVAFEGLDNIHPLTEYVNSHIGKIDGKEVSPAKMKLASFLMES